MKKQNTCAVCHKEIPSNANYCPHCGNARVIVPASKINARGIVFLTIIIAVLLLFLYVITTYESELGSKPIDYIFFNSPSSYSSQECRLAETDSSIYFSHPDKNQILHYDKSTKTSTPLDLYGTWLTVHNSTLYLIPENQNKIGIYDLASKNYREIDVADKFAPYSLNHLEQLLVSTQGYTLCGNVTDADGKECRVFLQLEFNEDIAYRPALTVSNVVPSAGKNLSYTTDATGSNKLCLLNLYSFSKKTMPLFVHTPQLFCNDDHYLFVSLFIGDPVVMHPDGAEKNIELPKAIGYELFVYGNYIFYASESGTMRYDRESRECSLLFEDIIPEDICFTSDGYMIMTGQRSSNKDFIFGYSSVEENTLQIIEMQ